MLNITATEFNSPISTIQTISKLGYGLAATTYGAAQEFGPELCEKSWLYFEKGCIYTIAGVITAHRFYNKHLAAQVEATVRTIAFVALVAVACIVSMFVSGYRFLAPIVRRQWGILVADFQEFQLAVSGRPKFDSNISEAIVRQDVLLAQLVGAFLDEEQNEELPELVPAEDGDMSLPEQSFA